ncbi:Holliday junction branch migration protein RuvA [Christensenellaceae bacterium OttesenSCG-928-K19]|nr:Holliday junction branch migration protein RuvA [Christensenellaceae bacterium OttesenSCG-928-K19]
MYEYIAGKVAHKATNYIVIDVGGVGYKIFADSFTINGAVSGEQATIYTYLKVAEDEMSLYGFARQEQKSMFEKLIGISGVGPKVALAVLSSMRVNDIAAAIFANDDKAFQNVPGIGKKTAQRLVLELKEKVDFQDAVGVDMAELPGMADMDAAADACAALVGLGYNRQEALAAVNAVKALGDTAEELVALALKRIGR